MAAKRSGKPLEFSGGLTQLQWCAATLRHLEEEVRKSKISLNTEHPSVVNLFDGLLSQNQESVQAVCLVLVEAVSRGVVSVDDIISSLMSSCASMPHWTCSIYTLAKLLKKKVIASIKTGHSFTNPYSLRSSPLPFISIFNSKPESGLVISDVAVQMLKESSSDYFSSVLLLLTPLFKYLFLHPSPSSEHVMVSSYLHSCLLTMAECLSIGEHHNQSKLLLQFLTNILPLSLTLNQHSFLLVSKHVERLTEMWCKVGDKEMVMLMVDSCLALCCKFVEMSLSFDSLLHTLSKIVNPPLKVQLSGHQVFCLSWLMLNSLLLPSTLELILHLVLDSLKLYPRVSSYLPLMMLPLVQVLSFPHSFHHHSSQSSLQQSAYSLILAIQDNNYWSWDSEENSRDLLGFQPYPLVRAFYYALPAISSTPVSTEMWLKHISIESQLSDMSSSSLQLLALTLSALLTRNVFSTAMSSSPAEFSLILKAFSALQKSQPNISPSLLPLVLYFLPIVSSPSLKLTLLHSLPSLASHKFSVGPTVNVLLRLAGNASFLPLSLRLLGKLWIQHDSVFPHFVSLLAQHKVPAVVSTEFDIAKGIVIRDICCKRGEQHGEDMLSHISLIFKMSKVSLAIALVTEALAALCQCDTADPVTVWSVFGESLLNTNCVPVVVASCPILSLAASVDSEQRRAAKLFKDAALKHLWNMVFSENPKLCSAALNGLSHFSMSDCAVEHLPPKALKLLNIEANLFAVDLEMTQLPASYCVDLVTTIPTESLLRLSQFLSSLLPPEVEAVPRGTISSVSRQAQVQSPLERAVRGVENLLQGICLANTARESPYGMVASTSIMLHSMTSSTDEAGSRSRVGHVASKEMKKYTALLGGALTNGRLCITCDGGKDNGGVVPAISCLVQPRRWALFMKKVCDCFIKVWLARNCPPSIWDNPSALPEKIFKARDWAKKEFVEKLTETLRSTPTSSSNVLLSLTGVVCATVLSPTDSGTETTEPETAWSSTQLLHLMITNIQSIIKGLEIQPSPDSPVSNLLSSLKECVDVSVFLLVCPVLIETALSHTSLSSPTAFRALEDFVSCLWGHFNASPMWYSGIILNEILVAMLPRMGQAESIETELVRFAEVSLESQSFEYLSVISSLVPTLTQMKHSNLSLGVINHLRALLENLSSDQLAMEHPQIMSLNFVNSCRLLYLNGVISDQDAMECVSHVADLATKAPHVAVYHFCLGSLMYGLMASGHPTVQDLADTIAVRWIQQLSDHNSPNELVVVMWGLAGLSGVNPVYEMMWYKEELAPLTFLDSLFPLLRDFLGKLANEDHPVVGCHATWILGCIYHSLVTMFTSMERVPRDYSYLPEGTLLPTLLSYLSDRRTDIRQVKCLLSALLSVDISLPPCDLSSILFPFLKSSELQVICVQLLIKQKSTTGMKVLARHIFNLLLAGCLSTETELLLLENVSSVLPLLPTWKYLQPLTTTLLKLYPGSQRHIQSLLKGIKDSITSATTTIKYGYSEGDIVQQIWEKICTDGRIVEICDTQGKMLLKLLAECLAAIGYIPTSFEASSIPVTRITFECLLQSYWVVSGKYGASNLTKIIHWTLHNYGVLDSGVHRVLMETLVEVIRHLSSVGTSQKYLVVQTELLHSLLVWTRSTEASASQMHWVLFLCLVVVSPTHPGLIQTLSLDLDQWLASFSIPRAPVLQEKVLQCIVEWFAHSDPDVHQHCLSVLRNFTSTGAYSSPVLWTTAAHLL